MIFNIELQGGGGAHSCKDQSKGGGAQACKLTHEAKSEQQIDGVFYHCKWLYY